MTPARLVTCVAVLCRSSPSPCKSIGSDESTSLLVFGMSRAQELEERKAVGNHLMKLQQYEQARDIYYSILLDITTETLSSTSLTINNSTTAADNTPQCDTSTTMSSEYQDIELACLNNLCSLFYLLKNYDEVIHLTTKILNLYPSSTSSTSSSSSENKNNDKKILKALYRQSQAYEQLGYVSIAMERISKLLEIEPNNQQAKDYLMKLMNENMGEPARSDVHVETIPSPPHVNPQRQVDEVMVGSLSNPESTESQEKTPPPSVLQETNSDYGFMNPSWLPQLPPEPSSAYSSIVQPPTETITQTFETEIEKNKIKNSIFLQALTSLQSSSSLPSSSTSSHQKKSKTTSAEIPTSQQVQHVFHELLQEEEELKNLQTKKSSSAPLTNLSSPSPTQLNPSSSTSASSLRSKKVISTTAHEEWLSLMKEEECTKQLVEEKKRTKNGKKKKSIDSQSGVCVQGRGDRG